MSEPRRAQNTPFMKDLPAGEYSWCACGLSKTQPFCDGSHRETTFMPVRFTIKPRREPETVWLCGCKQTRTPPFCDGTHNTLPPG